eukprot:6750376-Pyramimonas_sp.AAC.1
MASADVRFAASASARSKHMRSDAVQWIVLDTAPRCPAWPPNPGGIICSITSTSSSQQVFWCATSVVPVKEGNPRGLSGDCKLRPPHTGAKLQLQRAQSGRHPKSSAASPIVFSLLPVQLEQLLREAGQAQAQTGPHQG